MSKGIANRLLGIFFNLAAALLLAGALLIPGAVWGGVEVVWLIRMGIVLQLVGILLLAADYFGFGQDGYSPLRWWIDRLNNREADAPVLWPRQTLLTVGVSTLVTGLLLQFLASWAYGSLGRQFLCMFPLLASSVGGDVHAVSHSQAQEHPPAVGIDDLPVDGEHQQRYQRKHPQPHEQNESHRAEDVLVTDSSILNIQPRGGSVSAGIRPSGHCAPRTCVPRCPGPGERRQWTGSNRLPMLRRSATGPHCVHRENTPRPATRARSSP